MREERTTQERSTVMAQTTTLRCDDCSMEFELYKDLASVSRCTHGGSHRSVRIHRPVRETAIA